MCTVNLFKRRPQPTAAIAKERLRLTIAQERSARDAPDSYGLIVRQWLEELRNRKDGDSAACVEN